MTGEEIAVKLSMARSTVAGWLTHLGLGRLAEGPGYGALYWAAAACALAASVNQTSRTGRPGELEQEFSWE